LEEIIIIAAMLSAENIWFKPHSHDSKDKNAPVVNRNMRKLQMKEDRANKSKKEIDITAKNYFRSEEEERAEIAHSALRHPYGDHLTYLNIFEEWQKEGFSQYWCEKNFINFRSMRTVRKIRFILNLSLVVRNHLYVIL
jgi:hypothetical protein